MGNNNPPGIRLTGVRASIPPGYILGRVSAGIGGVELISVGKAQATGLIPTTLPPSGPAGGDLSGAYPNPTVAKINTQTLPAPTSTPFAVLMYSSGNLAWVNQHLNGGTAGQVPTKNSGTDFDISWATPHYLIAGGTTGQVLSKNSNTDYDVAWTTPSAGGSGTFASSFWLDGTHGYVAEVDSNALVLNDSLGRGIYSVDPVLPVAMLPAAGGYISGTLANATVNKVKGITDGSSAAAGDVGELIVSILPFASAVLPSNDVPLNITSITLTPGDWDVTGVGAFFPSTTSASSFTMAISSVSNTLPNVLTDTQGTEEFSTAFTSNASDITGMGPLQFNVTVNTTVYLILNAVFTGAGTPKGWGTIRARRMR